MKEQYDKAELIMSCFKKYLKKEDQLSIEALITSEQLTMSLNKLLTSPELLELSLQHQKEIA
jgi:hypothetical protein